MEIFVSAIGSGHTLCYPHNKGYSGVISIIVKNKDNNFLYSNKDQNEIYESKIKNVEYKYKKLIEIKESNSFYHNGKIILKEIDKLIEENKKIKFHIEISASYKFIGHILTFIASLRYKNVNKLTFLRNNNELSPIPIIFINLNKKENNIFKEYYYEWLKEKNIKISRNKFVMEYKQNKSYLYRIFNKCKKNGLMDENNQITDFGKLYLESN